MQGVQVRSLVRDLRPHLPCSQKNMKQKKYCNKFNKDFKNSPYEKNLFKNCHLLNTLLIWMTPTGHPSLVINPQRKDRGMRISVKKKWSQGYKDQILQPSSLLGLWLFQWNHSNSGLICQSLLILHGTKRNCNEVASLHARLDRYEYLRGFLVCLFLAHEMNVSLWGLEMSMHRIAWSPKGLLLWVCREVERCDVTYQQRECPWQPAPGFLGDAVLWQGANASALDWSPENNYTASAWGQIAPDMHIML